jgi:hypothetical protein
MILALTVAGLAYEYDEPETGPRVTFKAGSWTMPEYQAVLDRAKP